MFINITKRKNKEGKYNYYIYECESKRVDGKPRTTKRYVGKYYEDDLLDIDKATNLIQDYNYLDKDTYRKLVIKFQVVMLELWAEKGISDKMETLWQLKGDELRQELENMRAKREQREQEGREWQKSFSENIFSGFGKQRSKNPALEKELIKAGYRALSKKYHPDIVKDNGEQQQELNSLYDSLIKSM